MGERFTPRPRHHIGDSELSQRLCHRLHADGDTRLAFDPATDFTGTISDLITLQSLGSNRRGDDLSQPITDRHPRHHQCRDVTLSADGNTAYVADDSSGLQIIDVSNPSSPSLTATLDTPWLGPSVILSADGDSNTAYVADDESGLQIIDVSNPASPTLYGHLDTTDKAYGVTLSADGNTVFIADGSSGYRRSM